MNIGKFLAIASGAICFALIAGSVSAENPEDATAHAGGSVFSLSASKVSIQRDSSASVADKIIEAEEQEYQEFLSRGRYSRTRSIGASYSGSSGSYPITSARRSSRSRSSSRAASSRAQLARPKLRGGTGSYATLNATNGGFATLDGASGYYRHGR